MSADVLRSAASAMRHDCDHDEQPCDPVFLEAVADYLDHVAAMRDEAASGPLQMAIAAITEHADDVAAAYLGRTE